MEHSADACENAFVSSWVVFGCMSDVSKVYKAHIHSHGWRRSGGLAVIEEEQRAGYEQHLSLRLEKRLELLQTLDELLKKDAV